MAEIEGLLFDGKNAEKIPLTLSVTHDGIVSLSNKPNTTFKFEKIAVSPRIGDSMRFLTLPDGRLFESSNNDVIDKLISSFNSTPHSKVHSDKWMLKLAVMLIFLAMSWVGIHYGVPALTYKVAMTIPESMLIESGQEAMKNLDKKSFSKTKLSKKRQKELKKIFNNLLPLGHEKLAYKLHFRDAQKIGANAFALPSGDIIVTDDLIKISSNDDEVKSILLHEIAHVELRHAVQGTIKTSSLVLLVVAATGDITSLSTLLLGIPALLLDSSYNRKMEWDADTYSLQRMKELKINPIVFSNMLEKIIVSQNEKVAKLNESRELSKDKKNTEETQDDDSDGYWSSHPPSKDRIERMKAASKLFSL